MQRAAQRSRRQQQMKQARRARRTSANRCVGTWLPLLPAAAVLRLPCTLSSCQSYICCAPKLRAHGMAYKNEVLGSKQWGAGVGSRRRAVRSGSAAGHGSCTEPNWQSNRKHNGRQRVASGGTARNGGRAHAGGRACAASSRRRSRHMYVRAWRRGERAGGQLLPATAEACIRRRLSGTRTSAALQVRSRGGRLGSCVLGLLGLPLLLRLCLFLRLCRRRLGHRRLLCLGLLRRDQRVKLRKRGRERFATAG